MDKTKMVQQSVEQLKRSGFKNINAKISGYDNPNAIESDSKRYIPDITATHNKVTYVFEMIPDDEGHMESMGKRLRAISNFTSKNSARLYLVAATEHEKYIQQLTKELKLSGTRYLQLEG